MKTEIQIQSKASTIPFFSLRPANECHLQTSALEEVLPEIRNGSKVRSETNRAFGDDLLMTFATPTATAESLS